MSVTVSQDYYQVVKERHSVRSYDSSVKIPKAELEEILEEATLAPSSSNLQPWRFLVIDDQELKQKLHPIAYNQAQVLDASAIIAVFGDSKWFENAEQIYSASVEAGYMTEAVKQQFVATADNGYRNMDEARKKSIIHIDGGLVSMQLMLSARARGYDTVPMGGFDGAKFKEAFEVPAHYENIMLIAIGKAANPAHPTVRLPLEQIAAWNKF